jgi:hypothetical protein
VGGLFAWHDLAAILLTPGTFGRYFAPTSWLFLLLAFGFRRTSGSAANVTGTAGRGGDAAPP